MANLLRMSSGRRGGALNRHDWPGEDVRINQGRERVCRFRQIASRSEHKGMFERSRRTGKSVFALRRIVYNRRECRPCRCIRCHRERITQRNDRGVMGMHSGCRVPGPERCGSVTARHTIRTTARRQIKIVAVELQLVPSKIFGHVLRRTCPRIRTARTGHRAHDCNTRWPA